MHEENFILKLRDIYNIKFKIKSEILKLLIFI